MIERQLWPLRDHQRPPPQQPATIVALKAGATIEGPIEHGARPRGPCPVVPDTDQAPQGAIRRRPLGGPRLMVEVGVF